MLCPQLTSPNGNTWSSTPISGTSGAEMSAPAIQPIRQKLGKRTIFNLMGPLSNPAKVRRQLIGIARPAYVPIYADAMARLGTERTFIVSGDEGLDELSLDHGNELADVQGRSLMVHAGGDNHADHPAPLGGGGARVACGVIK